MMPFADFPFIFKSAFGVCIVVLFLASTMLITLNFVNRKWKNLISLFPISLVLYVMFQCVCDYLSETADTEIMNQLVEIFSRVPGVLLILALVAIAVYESLMLDRILKWSRNNISAFSIKEAVDNLPVGICCYETNGQIVLKNNVMEDCCKYITGEMLLNGNIFKNALLERSTQTNNGAIIQLQDNKVYSVFDDLFSEESPTLRILTISDITEEYKSTQTLITHQQTVKNLNEELSNYGKQIIDSITAQEILKARIKLHDEIGANLLASKRYITSGGTDEDRKLIEKTLHDNLQYLKTELDTTYRDEYDIILDTADKLDIKVNVAGNLTRLPKQRHIIVTGIHECITNTIRHAKGDEVNVILTETNDALIAEFTNNGNPPDGFIEERGGLVLLRVLTEEINGTMDIEYNPRFVLTLSLPKETD